MRKKSFFLCGKMKLIENMLAKYHMMTFLIYPIYDKILQVYQFTRLLSSSKYTHRIGSVRISWVPASLY